MINSVLWNAFPTLNFILFQSVIPTLFIKEIRAIYHKLPADPHQGKHVNRGPKFWKEGPRNKKAHS